MRRTIESMNSGTDRGEIRCKRVLVIEPIHEAGIRTLEREAEVVLLDGLACQDLLEAVEEVNAIVVRVAKVTREVVDRARHLQVIAKHGVGYDNIDVAAATARRIPVTYTPEANLESVAEHALVLMLSLARKIPRVDRDARSGRLRPKEDYIGDELHGKVLGVIGFGRIGSELARKCQAAFEMKVLVFDPLVSEDKPRGIGAELSPSLVALLREADFVSIHVPLGPDTTSLIGSRELRVMKKTAYVVNTSRGGIIDESALYSVLRAGRIAGAALDVLAQEPPDASNPLLALDNVIVTPHIAAITREAMVRMATTSAEDVLRVLRGERPKFLVNPGVY